MTKEYILNGNITIADFFNKKSTVDYLDGKGSQECYLIETSTPSNTDNKSYYSPCQKEELKYHLSWDWIMPVYKELSEKLKQESEKIREIKPPDMNSLLKHIDDCDCAIRCHIWGVRIDDVFYGITETIKLYNEKFKTSKS